MLILVVDDQPTMAAALTCFVQSLGYEACAVSSGEEALKKIEEGEPSLVLLDLNLSDSSGGAMLRLLRSNHRFDSLPVVICTAQDRPAQEEVLALGAQDFVSKSEVFEQLGGIIQRQLHNR